MKNYQLPITNYQLAIFRFFKIGLILIFSILLQSCNKEEQVTTESYYQSNSIPININTVLTKLQKNNLEIDKELQNNKNINYNPESALDFVRS